MAEITPLTAELSDPRGIPVRFEALSRQISELPSINSLIGDPIDSTEFSHAPFNQDRVFIGYVGWGLKRSSINAFNVAAKKNLPFAFIEDGFLRSYSPANISPPLSLVFDRKGIYYACNSASQLEEIIESGEFTFSEAERQAQAEFLFSRLSKYNSGINYLKSKSERCSRHRILLIDQTFGDLSVIHGGATAATFTTMLAAARAENPGATVYVKTHPEVSSGRKRGYLTHVQDDAHTVVIREPVNPLSLIEHMDRVYVVTSTMGFEALLAGKPVTCFGVPWYAGWGVTDDRVKDSSAWARRTRRRTVDELFAAAYLHYTRYLNPETHERGTIFDVINWLVRQKAMADRMHGADRKGRVVGVGFRRWKAANLKPLLGLHPAQVLFVPSATRAARLQLGAGDTLACWGAAAPEGVRALAQSTGARLVQMEDGFIRSVGLGSDLIPPRSLVLDATGIYFDASRPSDLEQLLSSTAFSEEDLAEARRVREFIVAHGITKYNLEPREPARWPVPPGQTVVVVPGQVEDDASIRLGCTHIRSNRSLLQAVRAARPGAFIVYKPHPDVASGNRRGRLALDEVMGLADHVETRLSITSCIEACDELHTMTSLSGFDALLRGKKVVTYGQPFYAGWGLTEDLSDERSAFARRQRRLTLDELVAGCLLKYPVYWDPLLKGYSTCMAVLRQIVREREALERDGKLARLRGGLARRFARKVTYLARAWLLRAP